jgi:Flp pilus assembly protein TadG
MKGLISRIGRGVRQEARGSEVAETAIILPLLFMFFMAIFWFGQAFRVYGAITQAARQGARAAVAPICSTCTIPTGVTDEALQNATTAVTNSLTAAGLNTAQLQPYSQAQVPGFCQCGTGPGCGTTVSCDSASINICVQENVQLSYASTGGAGTCGTSVSMRYKSPFSFPIPFTNLDLQNVSLYAQSEMRSESQ